MTIFLLAICPALTAFLIAVTDTEAPGLPAWPELAKAYGYASPMIALLLILWLRSEKKLADYEKKVEAALPLLTEATKAIDEATRTQVEQRRDRERDLIARLEAVADHMNRGDQDAASDIDKP